MLRLGLRLRLRLGERMGLRCLIKPYHPLKVKSYFSSRVGGWLENWGLKLISTQVVVEVEV